METRKRPMPPNPRRRLENKNIFTITAWAKRLQRECSIGQALKTNKKEV
jgi:hypothetical protein